MQRIGSAPGGGEHEGVRVDQRAAFAELADHHLAGAYRLAGVILGDPVEAQDATHDAVVAAWRRYGSLRDPARFEAWFQRILVNVQVPRRLTDEQRRLLEDFHRSADAETYQAGEGFFQKLKSAFR